MKRTSFFATPQLRAELSKRGDMGTVLRSSLRIYFELLEDARSELKEIFTTPELTVLTQSGTENEIAATFDTGILADPFTEYLKALPEETLPDGVDRDALISALAGLNNTQYTALIDALSRFWRAVDTGMKIRIENLLD